MKDNAVVKIVIAVILGFIIIKSCSTITKKPRTHTRQQVKTTMQKTPVDILIRDLSDEANFSIILYDMDVEEPDSRRPNYKHKYRVLVEKPDTVLVNETDWEKVPETFFQANINNMGMEIASKADGKVQKQAAPAGYNNYVGNEKYGRWSNRNGSSFWEFYGRYAFMTSMFNLMYQPAYRTGWNTYRGSYYGTGRPYYGNNNRYGTKSYASSASGKNTTWGSKPSTFKSKVRSQVSRSSGSTTRKSAATATKRTSSTTRTNRSSSRSSYSSSYRSRSGGYGK